MLEDTVTRADLLVAWRDASRAAELAERLASLASEAADQADASLAKTEGDRTFAEATAEAAQRAAQRARAAANQAADLARERRERHLRDADDRHTASLAAETEARQEYERSEADGRREH